MSLHHIISYQLSLILNNKLLYAIRRRIYISQIKLKIEYPILLYVNLH